jgi:lipoprotein-anchoring transpeptidase ErfK/SrfK
MGDTLRQRSLRVTKGLLRLFALGCILQTAIACQPKVLSDSAPPASPQPISIPSPQQTEAPSEAVVEPIRLVISLSRREVGVYSGKKRLKAYPIAVGRDGWETPTGQFEVKQMLQNPTWINPMTGKVVPTGDPNNPLGDYWIGFWTDGTNWIGFHGTPDTKSVGKAASHGCIRMHARDVEDLYSQVGLGTPVTVIN